MYERCNTDAIHYSNSLSTCTKAPSNFRIIDVCSKLNEKASPPLN